MPKKLRSCLWYLSAMMCCLFDIVTVYGQSYSKFILPGKVWETSQSGGGDCGAYADDLFFIADDTLINGITYAKLKIKHMDYPSNYPFRCKSIPQTTSSVFAYIREDTVAKKVYEVVKKNASWVEGLYLDFSLSVGDSVPFGISRKTKYGGSVNLLSPYPEFKGDSVVMYFKVKSIDTTRSSGFIPSGRKIIKFQTSNPSIVNEWTLGIGGSNIPSGFFMNIVPEYMQQITNLRFNNRITNGELVLGLAYIDNPNVTLDLLPEEFSQIDIYNSNGVHIATLYDKQTFSDFCISPPTGLVILKIASHQNVSTKKVVFVR